jgi:hypothetical protein
VFDTKTYWPTDRRSKHRITWLWQPGRCEMFYEQSSIALVSSFRWYVIPKCPWTAVGAFGPPRFISDFAIGHRTWGVTSHLPTFVSYLLSAFLRVSRLMGLPTQLTAVLRAGSLVTRHSFLNLLLCFSSSYLDPRCLSIVCTRKLRVGKVAGCFINFFPGVNLNSRWN